MLESPSGSKINPLFIRSVSKQKHFWSEKFYLTVGMQGGGNIEYENLSSVAADDLMERISSLINQSLSSAMAYDEAREGGQSHGYDYGYSIGHGEGHENGYQEAKDAFWSYNREEYRLNDYNIGFEAGKRDAEERTSERWSEGYNCGRDDATEELNSKVSALEADIALLRDAHSRWKQRALHAEASMTEPKQSDGSFDPNSHGRYSALRRSLAKLFHPDYSSGSSFEKAIRQELFKEIWAEIDGIEKRYAE